MIGGGATGVEMAAALSTYSHRLASKYSVDPSLITVDLIDSGPRVLKKMHPAISKHAHRRLHDLDVNVYYNRRVMEEHIEEVYFKDMHLKTATILWTAGISGNRALASIEDTKTDEMGRSIVDNHLRVNGYTNAFSMGYSVPDEHYGMAQTAISHGKHVADEIEGLLKEKKNRPYLTRKTDYAVPLGYGWAAVSVGVSKPMVISVGCFGR